MAALEVFWLMLATAAVSGLLMLLSAFVTGYLVFRTKREKYDTLIPRVEKREHKPCVVDEFASKEDESFPETIMKMNAKFLEETSKASLKRVA